MTTESAGIFFDILDQYVIVDYILPIFSPKKSAVGAAALLALSLTCKRLNKIVKKTAVINGSGTLQALHLASRDSDDLKTTRILWDMLPTHPFFSYSHPLIRWYTAHYFQILDRSVANNFENIVFFLVDKIRCLENLLPEPILTSYEKGTVLMWACSNGNLKLAKYFVDIGASVDYRLNDVNRFSDPSPLYLACQSGNGELVKLLLQSGASVWKMNRFVYYNGCIQIPETPQMTTEITKMIEDAFSEQQFPAFFLQKCFYKANDIVNICDTNGNRFITFCVPPLAKKTKMIESGFS